MKSLAVWLRREQRRAERLPRLEDALLGGRAIAYIAHRLRYVSLRIMLRTVLHIVEVVALSRVFSAQYLGPILFLRHATILVSSGYWGALEAQRDALREARRRRDDTQFAAVRSRWDAAAVVFIALEQAPVIAFLLFFPREFQGFSIYDAYAIACGLRLAADTWARTQHSAVFSVARIWRPLWSMVLIDVFEVFGLLLAWLRIGAFAFAAMLVVSGAMRAASTLWFARATALQQKLPPPRRTIWRELRVGGLKQLPISRALWFATLNASLQLDSLAIVLLSGGVAGSGGVMLSMVLHALSPLLGAGFAWTRVFYFDFVKLRAYASVLLVARFGRLLDRVAAIYPLLLSLVVFPIAAWLVPALLVTTPLPLLVFVVARSLFALRQMEAYSYGDHRVQWRQSVVLVAASLSVVALSRNLDMTIVGISMAFALAALAGRRARPARSYDSPAPLLGFERFIDWLRNESRGLRLVLVTVNRRLTSIGKFRRAAQDWGVSGPQLQLDRQRLLMVVTAPEDEGKLRILFATKSAGTILKLTVGPWCKSGRDACARVLEDVLPVAETTRGTADGNANHTSDATMDALTSEFARQFPDGVCLTRDSGNVRKLGVAARALLPAVSMALSGSSARRGRSSDTVAVAAYQPRCDAERLYLIPRQSPRFPQFAAFRERLARASRLASMVDRDG